MPFIRLSTSKQLSMGDQSAVRDLIAEKVALIPGKTRENTMILVESGLTLSIGDPDEDCLFVDVRVYTAAPADSKRAFVAALSAALEEKLSIPVGKMYFNITEMASWGSNGAFRCDD